MPIINGEEMRKKLEENLRRLKEVELKLEVQTPIPQSQVIQEQHVQAQGN